MPTRSSEAIGLRLLRGADGDPALHADGRDRTYAEVRELVDVRRHELGATRRLVMIEGGNALEPVVTYLAALEGGHPVLFVDGGADRSAEHRAALIARFDPDVVAATSAGPGSADWRLTERRHGTRHDLHPDLAMLASTSGSTGSPKLVRLSRDNLLSNAVSIGDYLNLGAADRAMTTLPLHYCYGLSVVNSHLVAGASVVLDERSVSDEEFWHAFADTGATSFAGVPYTFELLEASGFADRELPTLRYVTQAGGRLDPDRVRRFARLGRERGFDFVVMYGQTEATARMAYLPPHLAERSAGAIGIPIPGGRFTIDAPGADGAGELVYEGPNVMMGYAEEPADFAAGRTLEALRTGDLARRRDDGLYEIVGRTNRFAKIFGLRIDLDRVERLFADEGVDVRAVSSDERLRLFVRAERFAADARRRAGELTGLPAHVIAVHAVAEFPRTSSGKPDRAALLRHAERLDERATESEVPSSATSSSSTSQADAAAVASPKAIRDLYAELLGRPDAGPDDSFASLGGDSLSYVEVAVRLEDLLGSVPREWPTLSARELAPEAVVRQAPPKRRRMPRLETPAVLRAIAIVLIVGTHANLFGVQGGAHLLLAVAGYNLARFQLADVSERRRVSGILKSAAQIVVPAVLWIGAVGLVTGGYQPTTALLVNNFLGAPQWSEQWQFWFLETIVWSMLALAVLFAVPSVDRLERRHPFAFALGALGAALLARVVLAGGVPADATERYTTATVVWCLALGWLVARSATLGRRLVASALVLVAVPGFFGDPAREAVVVIGVLVLIWLPTLPVPRPLVPIVGGLAAASMFTYLTHWQVYPHLEHEVPWLATVLSLAVGVIAWRAYTLVSARLGSAMVRIAKAVPPFRRPSEAAERSEGAPSAQAPSTAQARGGLRR